MRTQHLTCFACHFRNVGQTRLVVHLREQISDFFLVLVNYRRDDVRWRLIVVNLENVLAKISVKSLANNLLFSQKDPTKLLKDVLAELQAADRYRVIVVDATTKKFIGLVHRRTAEAYLATPEQVGSNPAASSAPTLQTYLDWLNGSGAAAKPTVVFLAETASLADVDAKLKETKGKDAIVTSDGTPDSPVIVYINDNDINEYRTT